MTNLFDLSGKTAVVIGGSSVLGSSMAVALGAYGAAVALVGRNEEKLAAAREQVEAGGGQAAYFLAEATSAEELRRALDDIVAWTGRVDILLHSVGANSATPFFDLGMEEWDRLLDVNLKSVVLACQVFGRQMIEQGEGGSIITISSVSSGPPLSKVFTYSAAKAALNSVTQFLAREWAPHRVRVNALIPGFFPAVQNRAILTPERTEAILRQTPFGRFGEPDELQGAAVWLAAERASGFVTGALIRVDGGFGAVTL